MKFLGTLTSLIILIILQPDKTHSKPQPDPNPKPATNNIEIPDIDFSAFEDEECDYENEYYENEQEINIQEPETPSHVDIQAVGNDEMIELSNNNFDHQLDGRITPSEFSKEGSRDIQGNTFSENSRDQEAIQALLDAPGIDLTGIGENTALNFGEQRRPGYDGEDDGEEIENIEVEIDQDQDFQNERNQKANSKLNPFTSDSINPVGSDIRTHHLNGQNMQNIEIGIEEDQMTAENSNEFSSESNNGDITVSGRDSNLVSQENTETQTTEVEVEIIKTPPTPTISIEEVEVIELTENVGPHSDPEDFNNSEVDIVVEGTGIILNNQQTIEDINSDSEIIMETNFETDFIENSSEKQTGMRVIPHVDESSRDGQIFDSIRGRGGDLDEFGIELNSNSDNDESSRSTILLDGKPFSFSRESEENKRRKQQRLEEARIAKAEREEEARQEAARQEAARQEAARQEAARQEAARKEEARQKAAEEAKLRAEKEAEEAARIQAEQEELMRIAAEEAAKRQALEEARIRAELEAKIRAEEQARIQAEEHARRNADKCKKAHEEGIDLCPNGYCRMGDFVQGFFTDTERDYECICDDGYEHQFISSNRLALDLKHCVNKNECLDATQNKCGCHAGTDKPNSRDDCSLEIGASYCVDTVGSYECLCQEGFFLDRSSKNNKNGPTCLDVNECAVKDMCQSTLTGRICRNTIGSYECICDVGFDLINGICVKRKTPSPPAPVTEKLDEIDDPVVLEVLLETDPDYVEIDDESIIILENEIEPENVNEPEFGESKLLKESLLETSTVPPPMIEADPEIVETVISEEDQLDIQDKNITTGGYFGNFGEDGIVTGNNTHASSQTTDDIKLTTGTGQKFWPRFFGNLWAWISRLIHCNYA